MVFQRVFFAIAIATMFASATLGAEDIDTYRDFDFRNTLHPDSPRKLAPLPWEAADRDRVEVILRSLYRDYPGLMKQAGKYGHIPLYKVSTKQLDYINQGAYAGTVYVGFFEVYDKLYMDETVIHELTHIADTARQFANSAEWRALLEPRIAKVVAWRNVNNITKPFSGWGRINADERAVLNDAGLPDFYAASSLTEALASIVAHTIMGRWHAEYGYEPPADIASYLDKTLFSETAIAYPAGAAFVRGTVLNRHGRIAAARAAFQSAVVADPDLYIAKYHVAVMDYFSQPDKEGRKKYLQSLQDVISEMSSAQSQDRLYYYREAVRQMFMDGAADAMMEICNRVNIEFPVAARSPREYSAYQTCGDAYYANGELEQALAEYEKAIALVPFKRYEMTNRIGGIKMSLAANENDAWKAHDEVITAQFKALAEKGSPQAALTLGKMYFWGTQLAKDDMKALTWLKKAYESNVTDAAYYLAELYSTRDGDYFDPDRARRWAGLSADHGDDDGRYLLGLLKIEDGAFDEGRSLLIAAAETGHSRAAYQLGNLYLSASYSGANPAEAEKWYSEAANKNLIGAQYALGRFYLFEAPQKDPMKALPWFIKAAGEGHVLSQYELGMMASDKSYSGLAEEDLAAGYRWLYLSLNNTNTVQYADLSESQTMRAQQQIERISQQLGAEIEPIKKTLDAHIEQERAKRPWQ